MKNIKILSGCLITFTFLMNACGSKETPIDCDQSDLALSSTATAATCTTAGQISLTATGGLAPYQYSLDGGTFQTSTTFTVPEAGEYDALVKDANACTFAKQVSVVKEGDVLTFVATTMDAGCTTTVGSIKVIASGGDTNYMFSIDDGTYLTTNEFTNLGTGDHNVSVKDGAGCETNEDVYVFSGLSLTDDIMPILKNNCMTNATCHGGESSKPDFNDKATVITHADHIKTKTHDGSMPKGADKLSDDLLDKIACWVNDGAPNN